MKVVFKNEGGEQYNKRWVRIILLVFGSLMTFIALTQIFCLIVKPKGYEQIVNVLGNKYIQQLIIGLLFLVSYYLFKRQSRAV
jgi:hypothetical protein